MKMLVLIFGCAFLCVAMCEDPQCPKYNYEEETLRKMIRMELDLERMTTDFESLKSESAVSDKIAGFMDTLKKSTTLLKEMEAKMNQFSMRQIVSTYVRWGREDCPGNGTELLYKGYMAGNFWSEYGSGTTSLCLPDTPTWAEHIDGYQSGARIYGTEIEVDESVSSKLFGTNVYNNDISCAVCASVRSSMIMVPGRSTCLPGWTEEYHGYLVASHPGWKASSDYVCLDGDFLKGQDGGNDQHVVKIVEAGCGSLPCPPYVEGREIACVVCTKGGPRKEILLP